ncbi:MAG: phosphoribosylformylglycinamidine synthase subunit PurL [Endomicrobium sp.]|jgi:phosphoribosylformylglycinamidine synthase|nr:phosphoribosylformylglycinamidine synthase subunit PurL [Endomicrobium sp.]
MIKKNIVTTIDLLNLSNDELVNFSQTNVLSLSLEEMQAIQKHFKQLNRNPTDIELETIAQTWSEHCKHKTLTGIVEYTELIPRNNSNSHYHTTKFTYNNLLKETIFKAAIELNKQWCLSIFNDNAGIIEFDSNYGVAFKVETHNHPSALEPYGGASTGIGGVIRDILGVGLGAKPLANTDVLCFGSPHAEALSIGMHSPKRIMKGVISGIRDYGNRMGIPTVNGAVYFNDGYIANPLVYCGCMGIIPKNKIYKKVCPGDLILLIGGKTGRDGIHGATFSSIQLDQNTDINAVQIGNPIIEKKILDTMLKARDLNLYSSVTDCGAGGLSSAIGELGEHIGAIVNLDTIPLKYSGLKPWEIWISEAQERMVLVVPEKNKNKIKKIFEEEDVDAVFIGMFKQDKKLTLTYDGEIIADLDMMFLHNGIPKPKISASYQIKLDTIQPSLEMTNVEIIQTVQLLLSNINCCSREWLVHQYDYEVQGHTIIKPLTIGKNFKLCGHSDATVIFPYTIVKETKKCIVLSCGLSPQYGYNDVYHMAASSIEESLRNAVAVGGNINKMALLDNFCWGNPNNCNTLGSLVRATKACYDMSKQFSVPFISGKDSLNNEYFINNKQYSIPPALLISAMGIIDDVNNTVTMSLKQHGNKLFLLGLTRNELGGSMLFNVRKLSGGIVPRVYPKESKIIMQKLYEAMSKKLIKSCHDCAEGGLLISLIEMTFSSQHLGVNVDIDAIGTENNSMTASEILFSESNGRFIVEVDYNNELQFKNIFKDIIHCYEIGYINNKHSIIIESKKHKISINENVTGLFKIWQNAISW